uniref:J domain-containing protein n=1 Tax=Aeromonas phage vB_AdhaM_G2 TaxID=3238786 RepID=A0AB39TZY2_9CAUD
MSKMFNELFESMTQAVAMKALGLTGKFTDDQLKAAYRKAAKDNHPDRGGSTEKMQAVNQAYEELKKSGSPATQEATWAQRKQKQEEEKHVVTNFVTHMFDKFFDTQAYLDYFQKMSGKKFTFERKITVGTWGTSSVDYKFTSEDRTVFFDLNAMAHVFITKALGAGIDKPELDKMGIMTEVLIDRKKVKMTQSNYNQSETEKFMKDPKILFPETKLKKAFSGDKKVKPLKKADYVLFVKKELEGKHLGGDDFAVDIGNGSVIYFSRMTWMRKGVWNISGRTGSKERWSVTTPFYEIETPENMDVMKELVQTMKSHSSSGGAQMEALVKKFMLKANKV